MQGLEMPAMRDELRRQPVEQLGMAGGSPRRPKSLGVATRPRPKWSCQSRLTITRVESGLSGSAEPAGQGKPATG